MPLKPANLPACALFLLACTDPASSTQPDATPSASAVDMAPESVRPAGLGPSTNDTQAAQAPVATPATPDARVAPTATAGAPAPAGPAAGAAPGVRDTPAAQDSGTANAAAPRAGAASPTDAVPSEVTGPAGIVEDPETGELVFRTEPIALPSGVESYTCFGATLSEDTVIDGFVKSAQPFVHHAQFVKALAPEPEGVSTCNEQFKLTWLPIFLAGAGASEMRFDDGIGHVIPAETQLVLQMHLLNATEKDIEQAVEIRMHKSTSPDPTPVAPWAIGSSQIQVPAHSMGSAQNVCTMNGPVQLLAVFPHMHLLGTRFSVEVGKSLDAMRPLYARDPYDFDDQRMEKVDISLEAGDVLRVTCDYMNSTDQVIEFGESTNDEMCFFVGFALGDAPAQADCPNLWEALFTL